MGNNLPRPRRDVVVIGGSAGAIESMVELVAKLREPFDAAAAAVIHLSPFRESRLENILSRLTRVPVRFAEDGIPFTEGRLYLAVPDYHLIVGPRLALSRGPREHFHRPAIDPLFRSAAKAFGPRVLAVLLSGSTTDGVIGAGQVKEAGGFVVAQDPQLVRHDRLPSAALAENCVDAAVSIDEIADMLGSLTRREGDQ